MTIHYRMRSGKEYQLKVRFPVLEHIHLTACDRIDPEWKAVEASDTNVDCPDCLREQDLPACAWPGGYTLLYFDNEGNEYCHKCATKARIEGTVITPDVFYEGSDVECCECGIYIESAYGDPEVDKSAGGVEIIPTGNGLVIKMVPVNIVCSNRIENAEPDEDTGEAQG